MGMSPSTTLATLRPDLGGSVEEFSLAMDREKFVGLRVLPVIEAAIASGSFGTIPVEELLDNVDTARKARSGYKRGSREFTAQTYATVEHGYEEPVDRNDANTYGDYFDAEMIAAEIARDRVLRGHERRVAAFMGTGTFGTGRQTAVTGGAWNAGGATPIDDVFSAREAVFNRTGLWPDSMVLNYSNFHHLRNTEAVLDRINSQGIRSVAAADVNPEMLARVFDLRQVIVAGSAQNTANKNLAATISHIWSSDYALVFQAPRTSNIKEPCLGRTIHWGGDGSQIGAALESYRDEHVRADVIRARFQVHEKIFNADFGQLITGVYQAPSA